ncbi:MAG: hypothetical protein NZ772_18585 [Cyanobacteria bacterium]|nr:hypothetical protein [Cyanobacteriota bacterium]MDW8203262.1 hypothetical protein [Cyanobacteriota bacterium SKYGB_h_bin112]
MTAQMVLSPVNFTADSIDNPRQAIVQFVETELRRSQVYHQFLATLQTAIGDVAEEAIAQLDKVLTKVLTQVVQLALEQCQTVAQSHCWDDEPASDAHNERYTQLELEFEQDVAGKLIQSPMSVVDSSSAAMPIVCTTKQLQPVATLETDSRYVPLCRKGQGVVANSIQPSALPDHNAFAKGLTAKGDETTTANSNANC